MRVSRAQNSAEQGAGPLLTSYFLGPKAQNAGLWRALIERVFDDYVHWRRNYFPEDKSFVTRSEQRDPEQLAWLDQLSEQLDGVLDKLKSDFPFYSPRYIGHMNSELTLPSVLGLFAGLLYNPNNVSPEGAPVTIELEIEVGELIAKMLGFIEQPGNPAGAPWGHLTSGGTIATLEALWVARQSQFLPLIIADLCRQRTRREDALRAMKERGTSTLGLDTGLVGSRVWSVFRDRLCEGDRRAGLLRRPADEQLSLLFELHDALLADLGGGRGEPQEQGGLISNFLAEAVESSRFNPASAGYAAALTELNRSRDQRLRRGVVFASEAAHYCMKKACDVLGYGREALRLIPLDADFRIDTWQLQAALEEAEHRGEYVAAVVAIAGTTEEGAVDPVHELLELREQNPFWLHVDAAWGGYVATVFDRDPAGQLARERGPRGPAMVGSGEGLVAAPVPMSRSGQAAAEPSNWGASGGPQEKVLRAFGAIGESDSVVVDPHKLGYVPYPAGAVIFRNGGTRLMTAQAAPYIGAGSAADPLGDNARGRPEAVGEYALEGSKPGASATAVWLSHRTIPLTAEGHGAIVGETLLAAQRLAGRLRSFNSDPGRHVACELTIGFQLVVEPHTNVVTFLARPLRRTGSGDSTRLERLCWTLADLNALNRGIYERLKGAEPALEGDRTVAEPVPHYRQPFFVSRTRMESSRRPSGSYSFRSVQPLLAALLPPGTDHELEYDRVADGVFAIRCVVMNPYYRISHEQGDDHLEAFVDRLYAVGREVLARFERELFALMLIPCDAGKATSLKEALDQAANGSLRGTVIVTDASGREAVLAKVRAPAGSDLPDHLKKVVAAHTTLGVEGTEMSTCASATDSSAYSAVVTDKRSAQRSERSVA